MICITNENIFNINADVYVNPVNCVGVMGKGLALQFAKIYPKMLQTYRKYCYEVGLKIGDVLLLKVSDEHKFLYPKYIANFVTKIHFKQASNIKFIEAGLKTLVTILTEHSKNIQSIAIPALGCGLGKLNYSDVYPLLLQYLKSLSNLRIFLIQPQSFILKKNNK